MSAARGDEYIYIPCSRYSPRELWPLFGGRPAAVQLTALRYSNWVDCTESVGTDLCPRHADVPADLPKRHRDDRTSNGYFRRRTILQACVPGIRR